MAIARPQLQQRLPLVDGQGRLSNEGLRALNDAFQSIFSTLDQIVELFGITDALNADLATLANSGVVLAEPGGFPSGRVLTSTPTIAITDGGSTITADFSGTTDDVPEGAALYFTDARARASLSSGTGMASDPLTGVIAAGAVLAAYAGGDTPSAFTLGIVDSVDAAAWRAAIGAGTSSTTGTVTSVQASGGTTGLTFSGGPITGAGTLTLGGTLAVANGGTGVTTSTGSGSNVLSNSPTLVTPALGTPSSGTLTNCTGLPISTGISGLALGIATFLATPSSANLAAAVTDETGSGALVFGTSPSITTPTLASATISGTGGNLYSGTYTPTLTNVTNVAASTAYQCRYLRVGNVVTVSGRVDVDPTAGGLVELGISLPVASNFTTVQQCSGTAANDQVPGQSAAFYSDITNDRARMIWNTTDTANRSMCFIFQYEVI